MNKEIILLMITIILVILGFYCLYKYKKETLWVIACYVVTRAEEEFISEKFIIYLIEEALKTLQKTFKSSKDKQLTIVNEILKTATTGAPKDILKVAEEMQKDINSKGYIEGYLEGKTDLRGNNNIVGGLKVGIKL